MSKFVEFDIFGNEVEEDEILRNPFTWDESSVINTSLGPWQERKNAWKAKGIKSEIGRDAVVINIAAQRKNGKTVRENYVSIFDPTLCEVMYRWLCPSGGKILDPFAGGSVRGIVANYLGFKYTGIDIRQEQIDSNVEQANEIISGEKPVYFTGDSNKVLDNIDEKFDFVFSCPPYADLEVYSDLPDDISNMPYHKFIEVYKSIIKKACSKLSSGAFACFVVGEVRGKDGNYIGFVPDTIKAFTESGMEYVGEIILINPVASASMRCRKYMETRKLAKIHQNVLVFRRPE